jgi:hypothetical protein
MMNLFLFNVVLFMAVAVGSYAGCSMPCAIGVGVLVSGAGPPIFGN